MAYGIDLTKSSNEEVATTWGAGAFTGTRKKPIVPDVLERSGSASKDGVLPTGDTIHVVSEPAPARAPRSSHQDSGRLASQTGHSGVRDSRENNANGFPYLKHQAPQLTSNDWHGPPPVEDAMSKPHPLEPRLSGSNFAYPSRPQNTIVLTPKEHHPSNIQREYGHTLSYVGDGGRPAYAPHNPHHYPPQFYSPSPGPPMVPHSGRPLEPPRYMDAKYIRPYVHQHSPPAQFADHPQVRPVPASPSRRAPETMQWQNSTLTPNSIKPESSTQLPPKPSAPLPALIEFEEAAFYKVVDKYQQIVQDQHDYNVKTLLTRARAANAPRDRNSSGPANSKSTTSSATAVIVHSSSPFSQMKSIESERSKLESRKRPFQRLAQWYAKSSKAGSAKTFAVNAYNDETPKVPVYAHYTSLKHNMLVEDDNHRTFYTSFGDDPDDDDSDGELRSRHADGGIRDQEDVIAQNQRVWHKLNAMTERARAYAPYVDDLLSELGCDVESLLGYLVDDLKSVPKEVPKDMVPLWESRDLHLNKEGFYEDENSLVAKKIQRRWKLVLDQLPKSASEDGRKRAAAGLAFVFFSKRAGFSLWHLVRVSHLSQDSGIGAPEGSAMVERPSYDLQTYTDLACLACKAHECPGHGEWEDVRTRFTLEQSMGVLAKSKKPIDSGPSIAKRSHDPSSTLLGLNDDGTVTGVDLDYVVTNESALDDTKCCSDTCFWRKRNRPNSRGEEKSSWSREESHIFDSLYPAYHADRRGACILATSGVLNKTCAAIFERMVLKGPAVDLPYSISRRQTGETRAVMRRPPGYWQDHFKATSSLHLRTPFVPCNHSGPCTQETGCDCWNAGTTCEKFCNCSDECQRRFPGCSCHTRGNKKLCQTNNCECYQLNRECDPDLCHSCKAHEILDPVNRHNEAILEGKCHNVLVQRAVPKRTLIGVSKLLYDGGKYGFGLYMGEPCSKGDFIGEYVGEIVSDSEAGRRGAVYDKIEMSYLFDLNVEQTLDSMVFGNKTRFINDQDEKQANCVARVMLCGMVTRIGMFAKREIAVGEELFFDYGHGFRKRFDLIKRNDKGVAVVEKRNKAKSNPKKGKAKLKSPSYSKNGRRIGRPPKNLTVAPPPPQPEDSEIPEDPKPIPFRGTSRKRRRSDSSTDESSIVLGREPKDSEDESADADEDADEGDDTSDYDPHTNISQRERSASGIRTRKGAPSKA